MKSIEFGDETIIIAVSIGHSLEGTDLVVDAFKSAGLGWEVAPVEDHGLVSFQSVGHRFQDLVS